MTKDSLVKATAADNQLRCLAATTTRLVGEACRRHRTLPTASVALGRSLTGALLLGASFKDLERITVHFDCEGPIGNIIAQSDAHGNVRGYVTNPAADTTVMNEREKFDVRAIVVGGTLNVKREVGVEIGLTKEPYVGSVPIVSGEIGDDFAFYLAKSEQVNSGVGLGVLMALTPTAELVKQLESERPEFRREELPVVAAGGFIIQVLPGTGDDIIRHLEEALPQAPSPTEMVRQGLTPVEMLRTVLRGVDLTVLDEQEPRFRCSCSYERARLITSALPSEDLEDMLAKDGGAEVICHYCSEVYQIGGAELREMIAAKR